MLVVGLNRAVDLLAKKLASVRTLGEHPKDKTPVTVRKGRFGPYAQHDKTVANLPRGVSMDEITLDEAPAFLTDPKHGPEAGRLLADIGKRGRKAGFRLRVATQVPSLAELGGNAQALRSMLVGGNVVCLRTGDRVSAAMIGLEADPSALPRYFPDGEATGGLSLAF